MQRPAMSAKRRARRLLGCVPFLSLATLLSASPSARAQEAAGRSVVIDTSFTAQQTFTDNANLTANNPRSEAITELRPGIRVNSRSGRVQGSLDYALSALIHARDPGLNELQNRLRAVLSAEVVEQHAQLDAYANISQQAISAFGTQTGNTGLVNANQAEVFDYGVSGAWRSRLGDVADAVARIGWSGSSADTTSLGDGNRVDAALGLSGQQGRFGWGLNAGWQTSNYTASKQTLSNQLFGTLRFAPDPDVQLSVRGGVEGEGFRSGTRDTGSFWGWGVNWQPSERSSLNYQSDDRYFGRSHSFSVQHRMARAFFSYTNRQGTNDASGNGDPLNASGGGRSQGRQLTNYELTLRQLAFVTDPVLRDLFARRILNDQGLDPSAVAGGGFLSSGKTLEHIQNLSVGYIAIRTTFTLSGFRSDTEPLDAAAGVGGDLASVGRVRQQGYTAGVSHQLTPIASLALLGSLRRTLDEPAKAGNDERSVSLSLSGQLGQRTSATASVRHTRFDGASLPYTESAVVGSISLRF